MKLERIMWELTQRKWELAHKKVKLTRQAKFHPTNPYCLAFRLQRKALKEAFAAANASD